MNEKEMKYCGQLSEVCDLQSDSDIDKYIEAIEELMKSDDPEVLRYMLQAFRDVDAGEVQYELVEACERFPKEIYLKVFFEEGKLFSQKSPSWFELMFQSILNTDSYFQNAIEIIKGLPSDEKEYYINVIKKISEHTPKYSQILSNL